MPYSQFLLLNRSLQLSSAELCGPSATIYTPSYFSHEYDEEIAMGLDYINTDMIRLGWICTHLHALFLEQKQLGN
jgi:hypothetical protein